MQRHGSFCQCPPAETHLSGGGGQTEHSPPSAAGQQPGQPCHVCGGKDQEHRLKVLFQVLDVNGDGGICVNDLTIGLKKLGVHRTEHELLVSRSGLADLPVFSLCAGREQGEWVEGECV